MNRNFWKNKKVLVTGHTGFKGSWLTQMLINFDADVAGYALEPATKPSHFNQLNIKKNITNCYGDIRDRKKISNLIKSFDPEVVIHMAAQPLVRDSYKAPTETFDVNVVGTANLLESCIESNVKEILNVTTDKCYKNNEWIWGYREIDELGGNDPYSSSKACSELVTSSFRNSFFTKLGIKISTARAGNVIGGGDWSKDRLIPDFFRSYSKNEKLIIRYPQATRPWQHVLDPLYGYINLIEHMSTSNDFSSEWNFGPEQEGCKSVKWVLDTLIKDMGIEEFYEISQEQNLHESNFLSLDISKIKKFTDWKPLYDINKALKLTAEWYLSYYNKDNIIELTNQQIKEYENEIR